MSRFFKAAPEKLPKESGEYLYVTNICRSGVIE